MNILLVAPERRNIGNAFINAGCRQLLKTMGVLFTEIETLETSSTLFRYKTLPVSFIDLEILKKAKVVFIAGGSCLSRYWTPLYDFFKTVKAKKVLLGAGFYEDVEVEHFLYKEAYTIFDIILCRDEETYSRLSQKGMYTNVVNSLDMAFFIDFKKYSVEKSINYSVINLDSPEIPSLEREYALRLVNPLIVRNDPLKTSICNEVSLRDYSLFAGERWETYLRVFANAQEIVTNRVHTTAIAYACGIPVKFYREKGRNYYRDYLLKQVGVSFTTIDTNGKLTIEKNIVNSEIMAQLKLRTYNSIKNFMYENSSD